MAVTTAIDELAEAVRAADAVVAVGGRTQWEVGQPAARRRGRGRTRPRASSRTSPPISPSPSAPAPPRPSWRTVLGEHAQECALDPRSDRATVGGMLATGLSGYRRLRHGPLRDRVLEVRFVNADGDVVKGGGPTVKNVSGFDIPRLVVGSFGTIGVLTQVTLRCQPVDRVSEWSSTTEDPLAVLRRGYRPSCVLWDGRETRVLRGRRRRRRRSRARRDGHDRRRAPRPSSPTAPHRGRISVRPSALAALGARARPRRRALAGRGRRRHRARRRRLGSRPPRRRARAAEAAGGWLLREAGAPGSTGSGSAFPNAGPAGAHPRRVRSRRASSRRDRPTDDGGLSDGGAARAPCTRRATATRRPARRRGRAGRVRRVRPLPPALPDLPGVGARIGVAARTDRGDARSRARGRARRRRVHRVDGDMRAVPRLRSRVPVVGAVRAPHGRHARGARRARRGEPAVAPAHRGVGGLRARAAAPSAAASRSRGSRSWVSACISSRAASGFLACRRESLRAPLDADEHGDAVLFPGCVMDAWQRDVHRAALTVMRAAGARPTLPGPEPTAVVRSTHTRGGSRRRVAWRAG